MVQFRVRAAVKAFCSAAVESPTPVGSAPKLTALTTPRGSRAGAAAVRQSGRAAASPEHIEAGDFVPVCNVRGSRAGSVC
eukprot:936755-Prymnesium_polylepis.1